MMNQQILVGFLFLASCILLEVSSRPNNNDSMPQQIENLTNEDTQTTKDNDGRAVPSTDEDHIQFTKAPVDTEDILSKIKAINEGLKKPYRRQQTKHNSYGQPYTGGGYTLDAETLEKIKQMIASGKIRVFPKKDAENQQTNEEMDNDLNESRFGNSKALHYGQITPTIDNELIGNEGGVAIVPIPYTISIPVAVPLKSVNGEFTTNNINALESAMAYQTRQRPTLPFQIQWPLAPYFPILVKDPLLGLLHGGGWNNFIEYGQNADVCNRKQKSSDTEHKHKENVDYENQIEDKLISQTHLNLRQGRAIKKRTVSSTAPVQQIQTSKKTKKFFNAKPVTTKKPVKETDNEEPSQDTKMTDNGDLRTPFGDFNWFGNRKPLAPSPGFFINRLKVRRGGVAIAGPGGVATAGRGGTAIVGPGGLAYTQPGGLAVAGPAARVVALSSDADLHSVISRLQSQKASDGSVPRLLQSIPEGKVVATGPIVYYHPYP